MATDLWVQAATALGAAAGGTVAGAWLSFRSGARLELRRFRAQRAVELRESAQRIVLTALAAIEDPDDDAVSQLEFLRIKHLILLDLVEQDHADWQAVRDHCADLRDLRLEELIREAQAGKHSGESLSRMISNIATVAQWVAAAETLPGNPGKSAKEKLRNADWRSHYTADVWSPDNDGTDS